MSANNHHHRKGDRSDWCMVDIASGNDGREDRHPYKPSRPLRSNVDRGKVEHHTAFNIENAAENIAPTGMNDDASSEAMPVAYEYSATYQGLMPGSEDFGTSVAQTGSQFEGIDTEHHGGLLSIDERKKSDMFRIQSKQTSINKDVTREKDKYAV